MVAPDSASPASLLAASPANAGDASTTHIATAHASPAREGDVRPRSVAAAAAGRIEVPTYGAFLHGAHVLLARPGRARLGHARVRELAALIRRDARTARD